MDRWHVDANVIKDKLNLFGEDDDELDEDLYENIFDQEKLAEPIINDSDIINSSQNNNSFTQNTHMSSKSRNDNNSNSSRSSISSSQLTNTQQLFVNSSLTNINQPKINEVYVRLKNNETKKLK